jgi:hypothetical protein
MTSALAVLAAVYDVVLDPIIDALEWLGALIKKIGELVLWAVVSALNALIQALGFFAHLIYDLLPDMPAVPGAPSNGILGVVNYVLPIGGVIAGLMIFVGLWLLYLIIRVPLKWAKVL